MFVIKKITLSQKPDESDPFPKHTPDYPYPEPRLNYLLCFISIFLTLGSLSAIQFYVDKTGNGLIVGSFGASAVLYFASPNVPLAQPKNAIFAQILGAFIGISFRNIVTSPDYFWLSIALSVSLTSVLMMIFRIIHPPAGATALIASSLPVLPAWNGYIFVFMPVLLGDLFMLAMALLFNNLIKSRHYPDRWL